MLAWKYDKPHGVFNVGGGATVTLRHVIGVIEEALGKKLDAKFSAKALGDVDHTHAATRHVAEELGFRADIRVEQGIPLEVEWARQLYESA